MSESDLAARVQELEIKAMEQERLLADLSEVLYAQQKELTELGLRLHRLGQKVTEPGLVERGQDEKPPHY